MSERQTVSPLVRLLLAGIAANYILPFKIRPGDKFVILCRVSSQQQGRKGNAVAQEIKLRKAVEDNGGVVVDVIPYEWSGHGLEWLWKLGEAARVAHEHGAILLAAATNRLIRNRNYSSKSPRLCKAQAQEDDLRQLKQATVGVPLMTFLDPDASEKEFRSLFIRWGQEVKGNKGGRPRKTPDKLIGRNRRLRLWRLRMLQLHESGLTPRPIARQVSEEAGFRVTDMTVRNLIKWWEQED